jgi:hypothetical protein
MCEDRGYQWSRARNILHIGLIRNGLVRIRRRGRDAIRARASRVKQ